MGGASFFLEHGNAYPLQGESSSPDLTRKGNPQRFPFHTFPSLRGGGTVGMGGASFYFGFGEHRAFYGGGGRDVTIFLADAMVYWK